MTQPQTTILLLGYGAVGRDVVAQFPSAQLHWHAVVRDVEKHRDTAERNGVELHRADDTDLSEVIGEADIVVECSGVSSARQFGPAVIGAGLDLVLTSVGALADPEAARQLLGGPGRLHVTAGAIGGFDLLAATADAGGLDSVAIQTRKLATGLIRPWMSDEEVTRLNALQPGDTPVTVFKGDPIEAIDKFPANVNVSVALAWATRGRGESSDADLLAESLQRVDVELIADPEAKLSSHRISASGSAGNFELYFESAPSPQNPKTSGLTALSVAHTLRAALSDLAGDVASDAASDAVIED